MYPYKGSFNNFSDPHRFTVAVQRVQRLHPCFLFFQKNNVTTNIPAVNIAPFHPWNRSTRSQVEHPTPFQNSRCTLRSNPQPSLNASFRAAPPNHQHPAWSQHHSIHVPHSRSPARPRSSTALRNALSKRNNRLLQTHKHAATYSMCVTTLHPRPNAPRTGAACTPTPPRIPRTGPCRTSCQVPVERSTSCSPRSPDSLTRPRRHRRPNCMTPSCRSWA